MYAAMRDYDGRGPKTMLLELVMRRLKAEEPQGIIARVYAGHMTVSQVASLSALVSEAAARGDEVAVKILNEKGNILGGLVVSAAAQLRMLDARFGFSLNGGVFKAGKPLLGPLEAEVRASAPLARLAEPKLPPACGAVVLLLRRAGVKVDGRLVARMRSSLKGAGPRARAR